MVNLQPIPPVFLRVGPKTLYWLTFVSLSFLNILGLSYNITLFVKGVKVQICLAT
jgi:hypothetical protein